MCQLLQAGCCVLAPKPQHDRRPDAHRARSGCFGCQAVSRSLNSLEGVGSHAAAADASDEDLWNVRLIRQLFGLCSFVPYT